MEFDFGKATRHSEQKLKELHESEFLPPELLELIASVHTRQLEAQRDCRVELPGEDTLSPAEENLKGRPLIERSRFPWDREQSQKLFEEFATLLEGTNGPMARAAGIIKEKDSVGELELEEAFKAYLEGDDNFFNKWMGKTPDAPRTMNFLIQSAITPSIRAAALRLIDHLPVVVDDMEVKKLGDTDTGLEVTPAKSQARSHGHCPVCGSMPLIHQLREKQGYRYATCSFCSSEYRVRRIACALCDESDPKKLQFFDAKEEPGFRVDVCNTCKNYIKTCDFRELDRVAVAVLDDLASLPLDFLAVEEGYNRCTLSAWGF